LNNANDALGEFGASMYPYLSKLDLLRRHNKSQETRAVLDEIKMRFDKDSDIYNKYLFLLY
jgi:hypothetical protein